MLGARDPGPTGCRQTAFQNTVERFGRGPWGPSGEGGSEWGEWREGREVSAAEQGGRGRGCEAGLTVGWTLGEDGQPASCPDSTALCFGAWDRARLCFSQYYLSRETLFSFLICGLSPPTSAQKCRHSMTVH